MYLKTFEICVLKYMSLILLIFLPHQDYHGKQPQEKSKLKLDILTDIDVLIIVEKGIKSGICQAISRCVKVHGNYDKNK